MKKIIIISDGYLPIPAVKGGAVPSLIDSIIYENEKNGQIQITVTSVHDSIAEQKSRNLKLTSFYYIRHNAIEVKIDGIIQKIVEKIIPSRKGRKINAIWKIRVIKNTRKLLLDKNFDAIVLENYGYLTQILYSNKLLSKYSDKIFYHLHSELPDSVNSKIARQCNFILVSKYLSKRIINKYGESTRGNLKVLYNGIPTKCAEKKLSQIEREKLRQDLGFSDNDKVVCFIGRISLEKGVLELLQAFEKLHSTNVKLMIVGATEFGNNVHSDFEKKIHKICEKLGHRVKITGYIEHESIWKYYQIADLAALPSTCEEAAGLTILEAMFNGLPVITTNAGGIPEYMKKDFGFMLERGDQLPDRIAETIEHILGDFDAWKERGSAGRSYVFENFSEAKLYKEFCEIISK